MPVLAPEPTDDPGGDPGGGGGSGFAAGTTIFQATFIKTEVSSALRIIAYASVRSPDDLQFFAYLMIDGQLYQNAAVNVVLDSRNSLGAMPITLPAFVTGLPAGQHVIAFSIRNREPDGALTVLAGSTIEISELKRASV